MSGVGITYLWITKEFPSFVRLEGKRGDYEVYTPERTCRVESKIFIEGEYVPSPYYEYEMECGGQFRWDEVEPPTYCPECGGAFHKTPNKPDRGDEN